MGRKFTVCKVYQKRLPQRLQPKNSLTAGLMISIYRPYEHLHPTAFFRTVKMYRGHLFFACDFLYLRSEWITSISGCSVARYRASMGCWRSSVQIRPSRQRQGSSLLKACAGCYGLFCWIKRDVYPFVFPCWSPILHNDGVMATVAIILKTKKQLSNGE